MMIVVVKPIDYSGNGYASIWLPMLPSVQAATMWSARLPQPGVAIAPAMG